MHICRVCVSTAHPLLSRAAGVAEAEAKSQELRLGSLCVTGTQALERPLLPGCVIRKPGVRWSRHCKPGTVGMPHGISTTVPGAHLRL